MCLDEQKIIWYTKNQERMAAAKAARPEKPRPHTMEIIRRRFESKGIHGERMFAILSGFAGRRIKNECDIAAGEAIVFVEYVALRDIFDLAVECMEIAISAASSPEQAIAEMVSNGKRNDKE